MRAAYAGGRHAARAVLGAGLVRYRLGRYAEALADLERLVEAFPSEPPAEQAFFLRGWCHYMLGHDAEALAVGRDFLARHPQSAWVPDVEFWLGEYAFNRGDFAAAEAAFARLAETHPKSPLADAALYRAGRAAAAAREYLRAIEHVNRLAKRYPQSPLLPDARFAQGDALSELGQFASAILAFDEILKRHPQSPLADAALGRKGDCHFTLGAEDPARYEEARACYLGVLGSATAPADLKRQAEYKLGRCLEKTGRETEALEHYLGVVYGHVEERREGRAGSPVWFARAAFGAAAIEERRQRPAEAARLYRRVVDDAGPAAPEAAQRLARLQREAR
jgi:TolA-binding protein